VIDRESFGRWLREQVAFEAAGPPGAGGCPEPSRIWDAVCGGATAEEVDALLKHSLECPACAAAWRLARELASHVEQLPSTSQPLASTRDLRNRPARPAWVWAAALAASVILVAGGAALWLHLRQDVHATAPMQAAARWADLEVPVLEVPGAAGGLVFRDGAGGGELAAAIECYRAGDFAAAADGLGRWVEGHPEDVQARLLLGVALLTTGDVDGAVVSLEEVASLDAADTVDDARFYLALAYLKRGEESKARTLLAMIDAGDGRWQAEAERLLHQLPGSAGGKR
jgi:tetratricopeptide (TPR) repeat protein